MIWVVVGGGALEFGLCCAVLSVAVGIDLVKFNRGSGAELVCFLNMGLFSDFANLSLEFFLGKLHK